MFFNSTDIVLAKARNVTEFVSRHVSPLAHFLYFSCSNFRSGNPEGFCLWNMSGIRIERRQLNLKKFRLWYLMIGLWRAQRPLAKYAIAFRFGLSVNSRSTLIFTFMRSNSRLVA